jgi:hypothetical protein
MSKQTRQQGSSGVQVLASSWFDSFRSDMRSSSMLYRAAERSVRAVGYGTYWTAAGIYSVTAATGGLFTACMAARCGVAGHRTLRAMRVAFDGRCTVTMLPAVLAITCTVLHSNSFERFADSGNSHASML